MIPVLIDEYKHCARKYFPYLALSVYLNKIIAEHTVLSFI